MVISGATLEADYPHKWVSIPCLFILIHLVKPSEADSNLHLEDYNIFDNSTAVFGLNYCPILFILYHVALEIPSASHGFAFSVECCSSHSSLLCFVLPVS